MLAGITGSWQKGNEIVAYHKTGQHLPGIGCKTGNLAVSFFFVVMATQHNGLVGVFHQGHEFLGKAWRIGKNLSWTMSYANATVVAVGKVGICYLVQSRNVAGGFAQTAMFFLLDFVDATGGIYCGVGIFHQLLCEATYNALCNHGASCSKK